jgi:GNAT superfamily N-acetyltransferase
MEINIKPAKSEDWEILQKLNHQLFISEKDHDEDIDLDYPLSEKGVDYYKKAAAGKYGICFIAYSGEIPLGYIALSEKDFGYRKGKYIEVNDMAVDAEYRSQGIGKALMDKASEWAREQGATKLYVLAYWKNTGGINFYKKNGFSELGLELEKDLSEKNI